MIDAIRRALAVMAKSLFTNPDPGLTPVPTLIDAAQRALQDWRDAENSFQFASDPDLVDQAIYATEACKRRFTYLLGKIREYGGRGSLY